MRTETLVLAVAFIDLFIHDAKCEMRHVFDHVAMPKLQEKFFGIWKRKMENIPKSRCEKPLQNSMI